MKPYRQRRGSSSPKWMARGRRQGLLKRYRPPAERITHCRSQRTGSDTCQALPGPSDPGPYRDATISLAVFYRNMTDRADFNSQIEEALRSKARGRQRTSRKGRADRCAAPVTLASMTTELNGRGIRSARGGKWHRSSVATRQSFSLGAQVTGRFTNEP